MTSITAQQTKLDLELVPKENRLDIGKCNGRIPRGLKPKEEKFQVVLHALTLTLCYPAFVITVDVPEGQDFDGLPFKEATVSFLRELSHTGVINSLNDVVIDQMHQPWRTFPALINRSLSGKTTSFDKPRLSRAHILWGMYYQKNVDYVELLWEDFVYQIDNCGYKKQENMYYPRFIKVIIHHFLIQDKTLSQRNKFGMHASKDDYLINTLRFVSRREASQKYGAVLPECLTSPQMKESKAYKTYLGYATGIVPPKVARKFKKASPSKKDNVPVPADEEPVQKGKRVKRSAKKSSTTPTVGIVIREPPVETQSKRKEKVDVSRGKGINMLSEVALSEEAQMKEVRKKSLRDFHKSYPSGNEQENDSEEHESDSEQDTNGSESDSASDQQDDDDDEVKDDDDDEDDDNNDDKSEGDEDRGMDSDDVQDKKADGGEVVVWAVAGDESGGGAVGRWQWCCMSVAAGCYGDDDGSRGDNGVVSVEMMGLTVVAVADMVAAAVGVSGVVMEMWRLGCMATTGGRSCRSGWEEYTLGFAGKLFRWRRPAAGGRKWWWWPAVEVAGGGREREAPEHQECYDGLIKSYNLEKDFFSFYDVYSLKLSRDDKDKDEGPSAGSDRGLKKRKTSKDAKPSTSPKTKHSSSRSSKGTKS
nr:hypothetical protein [Tanacetum cinerariifolium]